MSWGEGIALVVAVLALAVALYEVFVGRRSRKSEGVARVVVESHRVYDNANAPAGRQSTTAVRNQGPATAYNPTVWCVDGNGNERTPHRYGGRGMIERGESVRLGMDLPPHAEADGLQVWIGWDDTRGPQERDTGIRLGA